MMEHIDYRLTDLTADLADRIELAPGTCPGKDTPCWLWTGARDSSGYGVKRWQHPDGETDAGSAYMQTLQPIDPKLHEELSEQHPELVAAVIPTLFTL